MTLDVGPESLARTQSVELPVLEEAEEFDLGLRHEVADFVEKNRASRGGFELADLPFVRARERPLLGAEQLGLDESRGEGGDVQRDIRALLPRRGLVDRPLALLPQEWRYVRGGTLMYWIMSMRASGRSDAAYRTMMDQYESLPRKSDGYALRLLFTVCLNFLETGDLERVRQMAQAALQQARAGRLIIIEGWLHYLLGMTHYCRNELDHARQHFSELVDKRYVFHAQSARTGMIGLARVHLVRGEISAAGPIMELFSQLDVERMGQEADDACPLRAQLAYRQGTPKPPFAGQMLL